MKEGIEPKMDLMASETLPPGVLSEEGDWQGKLVDIVA
jgi:hypothetical protein